MRLIGVIAAALALVAPAAAEGHKTRYYVALGDSLAVGGQPIETDPLGTEGYVDQLYAMLRKRDHRLALHKLGCGGESTWSMIDGSQLPPTASCGPPDYYRLRYAEGTQLATATAFMREHRGEIELVTINLGANDVGNCGLTDRACVEALWPGIRAQLTLILRELRRADPRARIVGMNYYVPWVGFWKDGPEGQALARTALEIALDSNEVVNQTYRAAGVPYADVTRAYHSARFWPRIGGLPLNVALTCRWTWMCAAPPLGPDPHPNAEGYGVIARAFADVLRHER
jgi:lysophospholipase L1-like esterase